MENVAMALDLHRLTVDRYEAMAEAGLLPERGVELFDGLVVEMSAKGARHAHAAVILNELLVDQRRGRYRVFAEALSLRLGPHDEPDPDFAIVRATGWETARRVRVDEVALIIEIADSSLAFDLGMKREKYAIAGVPEYWVIDVQTNRAHLCSEPRGGAYDEVRIATADETISPREYPDVLVPLALLFGRA